jgi:biopolymer transport protein ExbB
MFSNDAGSYQILGLVASGGFAMYPLLLCSLVAWVVIIERFWRYRRMGEDLRSFHLEALNASLRDDQDALRALCARHAKLPTSRLLVVALERISAKDSRLQSRWVEALERKRQLVNQDLRSYLWLLGTIGSAAPFIGLFGTVVGILRSFHDIARTGSGGFTVVAAGISESLIATAAGIVVGVISVMAYNAFQTKWSGLVLLIRVQAEEMVEILDSSSKVRGDGA